MKKTLLLTVLLARVAPGEPTIHVAWDETETLTPGTHYVVDTANPDFPDVILLAGSLTWRVWSTDSVGGPGDIGEISSPANASFGVKIMDTTDPENHQPGARNVKAIRLIPTGSGNYSNITGGTIAGDVEGDLIVQPNSINTGSVSLTINGDLSGDVTINNVGVLSASTVTGTVSIGNLTEQLSIVNALHEGASITIAAALPSSRALIATLDGTLNIQSVANDPEEPDDFVIYLYEGVSATGIVNFHDMGAATVALAGFGPGFGDIAGTLKFWEGIGANSELNLYGKLLETGVIDLNNVGIASGAALRITSGGSGSVINGGTVEGTVLLGAPQEAAFNGFASFSNATPSASVVFQGDGILEFTDLFSGNLCGEVDGEPLSVDEPLPANIYISDFGAQGRICTANACNASLTSDSSGIYKNRVITFSTSDTRVRPIRVRIVSLHDVDPPYSNGQSNPCIGCPDQTCSSCEGQYRYVGPPQSYLEDQGASLPKYISALQCEPHFQDWSTVGLLRVTGSAIVPSSVYQVERMLGENAACGKELTIVTGRWGDIVAPFRHESGTTQPDLADVSALVDKYRKWPGAPEKDRALLVGVDQHGRVNYSIDIDFTHIAACVEAFRGRPYPHDVEMCP